MSFIAVSVVALYRLISD